MFCVYRDVIIICILYGITVAANTNLEMDACGRSSGPVLPFVIGETLVDPNRLGKTTYSAKC